MRNLAGVVGEQQLCLRPFQIGPLISGILYVLWKGRGDKGTLKMLFKYNRFKCIPGSIHSAII